MRVDDIANSHSLPLGLELSCSVVLTDSHALSSTLSTHKEFDLSSALIDPSSSLA